MWVLFVVLQGYYAGALTMFVATPAIAPFVSLAQALQAYPEWNFVYLSGVESELAHNAITDSVYKEFWDRAKRNPKETSVPTTGIVQ